MAAALKKAGKPYDLIEIAAGKPYWNHTEDRTALLTALNKFLTRCLSSDAHP